jgi:hypothetical protein
MNQEYEDVFFDEPLPGGGYRRVPGTKWANPALQAFAFELAVDSGTWLDERQKKLAPPRKWIVTVPPRGVVTSAADIAMGLQRWLDGRGVGYLFGSDGHVIVPAEFDQAICTLTCITWGCSRGTTCRDPHHLDKRVIGGLCPRLVRVAPRGGKAPEMAPALVEARPTLTPDEVDQRLLARARGGAR